MSETTQPLDHLYRHAIAATGAVVYQFDYEGDCYVHIDSEIERLLGFGVEEIGVSFWNRIIRRLVPLGEARGCSADEAVRRFREGMLDSWSAEYECVDKSGNTIWLADSSVPIRDVSGRVTGSLGMLRDITDRKLSDRILLESERRLSQLMDDLPGMVYRCRNEPEWPVEFVSNGCLELTGYSPWELVDGQVTFGSLIHPDDAATVWADVQRSLAERRPFNLTYRIRDRSGSMRWVWETGRGVYSTDDELQALEGFIEDVSSRTLAERALRESEHQYRQLLENHPDGVAVVSGGRVVYANDRTCELLGYDHDDLISRRGLDLIEPRHRATILRHVMNLRRGTSSSAMEIELLRDDGTCIPIEGMARPILFDRKSALLAVFRDITARRDAEARERQHRERLAHAARLDTLGGMATGLAHEINQPLAGISTYANACRKILKSMPASPEADRLGNIAKKIEQEARRTGDIIHRMRNLVRKRESERTLFAIERSVENAAALTEPEARRRGIDIRIDVASNLPRVEGDEIQIEQVILNLIQNAKQAIHDDSPNRRIVVSAAPTSDEKVQVTVADTGAGIEFDDVERVFDAFVTSRTNGMGLGLSISRSIIEAHGGRMWVESNDGSGTTFGFSIPIGRVSDDQ